METVSLDLATSPAPLAADLRTTSAQAVETLPF